MPYYALKLSLLPGVGYSLPTLIWMATVMQFWWFSGIVKLYKTSKKEQFKIRKMSE